MKKSILVLAALTLSTSVFAAKGEKKDKRIELKSVCQCECGMTEVQFDTSTNTEKCATHNKKACETENGETTLRNCKNAFVPVKK